MKTRSASSFPGPRKPHKPFRWGWTFPTGDARKQIWHSARKCEAVVRDKSGKIKRDERGRAVRKLVTVPAYTQVVR
ncbi:MAG TPA: hypothetical protein VHR97_14710 [Candidatus Baltobacteraceae bacterium]|jgi:hypothetical protein|nr:hypothetical protein [Candidatus Baltobacteraceae bacterium]